MDEFRKQIKVGRKEVRAASETDADLISRRPS